MSPGRTNGKTGAYEIDRIFAHVGRIRRSSGTESLREYRNRVALLDKLHTRGQYDLLRAFKDGRVSIEQLVEADREDRLASTFADLQLHTSLWDAIEQTLPRLGRAPSTRERYADAFRRLQRKAKAYLPDDAQVADLHDVPWDDLWEEWGASASDWMNLRIATSSFLTRFLDDKYHPFARRFRQIFPAQRVARRYPNLSLATFQAIVTQAPPHAALGYWALIITGMRVGEYLACRREHLFPETHTIQVPGTKTDGSFAVLQISPRLWDRVDMAVPPRLAYKWLREYWNRACLAVKVAQLVPDPKRPDPEHPGQYLGTYRGPTLHDLRHCHGQWAIDAGVAESKVQSSLRHDDPNQTRQYVRRAATRDVSDALADLIINAPAPLRREA